jgi:hypothetical protein
MSRHAISYEAVRPLSAVQFASPREGLQRSEFDCLEGISSTAFIRFQKDAKFAAVGATCDFSKRFKDKSWCASWLHMLNIN